MNRLENSQIAELSLTALNLESPHQGKTYMLQVLHTAITSTTSLVNS